MVVVGVVRYGVVDFFWLDDDGFSGENLEKVFCIFVVPSEATAKNLAEFVRDSRGKNQDVLSAFKCSPDASDGAVGKLVSRNKDIGIKDDAQLAGVSGVLHRQYR